MSLFTSTIRLHLLATSLKRLFLFGRDLNAIRSEPHRQSRGIVARLTSLSLLTLPACDNIRSNTIVDYWLEAQIRACELAYRKRDSMKSRRPFAEMQARSFTGSLHTFLHGSSLFFAFSADPWAVQLSTEEPVDFFVLTGEEFHLGYQCYTDHVPNCYEALRSEARDGVLGIPIVLCYGLIESEDVREDGTTTVRKISLPSLSMQQESAATAVLLSFFRATSLTTVEPSRLSEDAQRLKVVGNSGQRNQAESAAQPQHCTESSAYQLAPFFQQRVPMSREAFLPIERFSILSMSEWSYLAKTGIVNFQPGFFENTLTFPEEELPSRIDRMRQAALGLQVYRISNHRTWIPARRRTILERGRGRVGFAGELHDGEERRGVSYLTGLDIALGHVGFTSHDENEIDPDVHEDCKKVMDLINWEACEESTDGTKNVTSRLSDGDAEHDQSSNVD